MNTQETMTTLPCTPEQYAELKARASRNNAWVDSIRDKRSGWVSYKPEDVPTDSRITNEELAMIEVYEWLTSPPDRYFLYINRERAEATTWMGNTLGSVRFGREYKSPAFWRCSTRVPITVVGTNGKVYHGTYYKSSGDYARIKIAKSSR